MPLIERMQQSMDDQVRARGRWREVKEATRRALRGNREQPSTCRGPYVGPHNRCKHATPPPEGYRRCEGDPGCEIRLAVASGRRLCLIHEHEAAIRMETPMDRLAELMEATQ